MLGARGEDLFVSAEVDAVPVEVVRLEEARPELRLRQLVRHVLCVRPLHCKKTLKTVTVITVLNGHWLVRTSDLKRTFWARFSNVLQHIVDLMAYLHSQMQIPIPIPIHFLYWVVGIAI